MTNHSLLLQGLTFQKKILRFYTHQHPYVCEFIEELNHSGLNSLFGLENQGLSKDRAGLQKPPPMPPNNYFERTYVPSKFNVAKPYPKYNVDFELDGAYSKYNWELFFHIPLFIASQLAQDQRHEEAMRWVHYIFNPMTESNHTIPERYWHFKPFRNQGVPEQIQKILLNIQKGDPQEVANVEAWRKHPFQPHRIARTRPGAYMKTVVLKYIDNLIEWGDKLFRRDTIESINEATQLYVLAANLLGERPPKVPDLHENKSQALTYETLRPKLDAFSNVAVALENMIAPFTSPHASGNPQQNGSVPVSVANLAFCIPHNDKLLEYWDKVDDRLFKIRHCMNIEGTRRELPLFEPPIDPALLVRATAMGLDLSTVLDDLYAPLPHYRFSFILQKAREFCEEVKQLGGTLLSILEKKDAEALAQIRATHEKDLLKAVLETRKKQVKESEEGLASLEVSKEVTAMRKTHYETISTRLAQEKQYLDKQVESVAWQMASQDASLLGSSVASLPDQTAVVRAGIASAVGVDTRLGGGSKAAEIANLVSIYLGWLGQIASLEGTTASYKAGLIRSQQDRDLQITLATKEEEQIDKQIEAAKIRIAIAENELRNHEKQIEQSEKVESFLREKFTDKELYNWMKSQVSAVYFQTYRLAYDMAKQAERAYQNEMGTKESSFIEFGSWDNLHKGLLAGEKMSLQLRRLEKAYLDDNKRIYELTKQISLRFVNPIALITLKETGVCEIELPENLFDQDYPGHYSRRIKSVSLTIPCVVGPYTSVNCTLSLMKSRVRNKSNASNSNGYAENSDPDKETRFDYQFGAIQRIATSHGKNDAGMFELNFRDERLLPFEGEGAISTWRIELPKENNNFDFDTISDVILTLNYTARDGGELLRDAAAKYIHKQKKEALTTGSTRLFSIRHEFAAEWAAFKNQQPGANSGFELSFELLPEHYPYWIQEYKNTVSEIELIASCNVNTLSFSDTSSTLAGKFLKKDSLFYAKKSNMQGESLPNTPAGKVSLSFNINDIDDMWLVVKWKSEEN